jgi:hypothetical protein
LNPTSSGPDQGVDSFWTNFPAGVQPLTYNRIAYYALMMKFPIIDSTLHQNDATQWADLAPIALMRARRTRLFDAYGNQTGYAFNTNPAWHFVDANLALKIKPDYNIDLNNGPTPLTEEEQACFNWESITEAATYFDQMLANGRRRFTGNYNFVNGATLPAVLEQVLLCCRSYTYNDSGQIYLICDKPRASTFIVSRNNMKKFEPTDQPLHTSANRYIGKFRDLLVPACAQIASIVQGFGGSMTVTTVEGHPCQAGDDIVIGGEGAPYDGYWTVDYVPILTTAQIAAGVQIYTMTLTGKGSNYATPGPAGGYIGLIYSRFKERAPEFQHNANQLARGAIGLGVTRQKKKIPLSLDLSVLTYDQAARILMYERDRALGQDVSPYVTPASGTVILPFCAADVNGNLIAAQRPGDRLTLDTTANVPYAGDYEFIDAIIRPTGASALSKGSISRAAAPNSMEIEIIVRSYDETRFYDSSNNTEAGWEDVPGSDPGNESAYTGGATASGGSFAFITGALPSGQSFQLPSVGYPSANVLSWASPQGYLLGTHQVPNTITPPIPDGPLAIISNCSVDANLNCILQYFDGANTYNGDVNYAALAWSAGTVVTVGSMTFVEITLANGEVICFGRGLVEDGGNFALPAGFTTDKMFAWTSPYDDGGTMPIPPPYAHGFTSWVDGVPPTVHLEYVSTANSFGATTTWSGRAQVLVFAWKNNSGACTVTPVTGGSWMTVADTSSSILGVGLVRLSHGQALPVPAVAASGTTLQTIQSPRSIAAPSLSALTAAAVDGVFACYLDAANSLQMVWSGTIPGSVGPTGALIPPVTGTWNGDAMVFAIFWGAQLGSGTGSPTISITPVAATLPAGNYQQFAALVTGESNANVTWAVDGIAGGSSAVGTIDATGVYTAPAAAGVHTITATSVASSTLTASATATVTA